MSNLSYTECEIDTGSLESHADVFQELHAKISGRSGEFHTIAHPVSEHFDGLVGEGLKSVAKENQEAWSSAMMACTHAYGVIQKVIGDVKWYEEKIEEIKADLAVALGSTPSTGNELDDVSIRNAVVVRHNNLAKEAWEKFEIKCEESEDLLQEGPTPGNIKELIEAGYLGGNISYATTGDIDFFYFDESDAVTMANFFKTAAEGYEGSIEALEGQLGLLNALVLKALQAQQSGEKLSDNEIDFLEALFAELEIEENRVGQMDGSSTHRDFLDFIEIFNESEYIDDRTKGDINRNLANSMLLLSDEGIGGGIDRIPQDVQEVAFGPSPGTADFTYEFNDWAEGFLPLSDFLAQAGPGVEGGTEFSTALLATSSQMLGYADMGAVDMTEVPQEAFSNIIDVASRKEEANYIILTGEDFNGNAYQHHEHHEDINPKSVLEVFYTYDWNDDGAAVRGITDWIAVDRETGIPEEARNEALVELMNFMEDEDFRDAIFGTGEKVKDEDGVVWLDVSAGHLNPELADGFGDIFLAYMEEFSETDGIDQSYYSEDMEGGSEEYENRFDPETGRLELSPESRLAFTQVIMGDEEAASRIYEEVLLNTGRTMEEYASNTGERSHVPTVLAGSLQGLVEEALANESESRSENHKNAAEYQNKVTGGVVDTLGGVAGDLDVSGFVIEVAKFSAKEALAIPVNEAGENADTIGSWAHSETMQGMAIAAIANSDPDFMEELEAQGIAKEDKYGDLYVPVNHVEWGVQTSAGVLATEFDAIDEIDWTDGESSTANAVYNFLKAFGDNKSKWENVSY